MASGDGRLPDRSENKLINAKETNILCDYCNRKVVDYYKCAKCEGCFHPSCWSRGRGVKSAPCEHVLSDGDKCAQTDPNAHSQSEENSGAVPNGSEVETLRIQVKLLNEIIIEVRSKNYILMENNRLLLEKTQLLEENIAKLAAKNGKQVFHSEYSSNQLERDTRPDDKDTNNRNVKQNLSIENSHNSSSNAGSSRVTNLSETEILRNQGKTYAGAVKLNQNQAEIQKSENETNRGNKNQRTSESNPTGNQSKQEEPKSKHFQGRNMDWKTQGPRRKVWLYLYRVNKTADSARIKEYILNKPGYSENEVNVLELPSQDNSLKRFVVTALIEKKEEMYNSGFWPLRIGQYPQNHQRDTNNFKKNPSRNCTSIKFNENDTIQHLVVVHQNLCSIGNTIDQLNVLLNEEHNCDFFCATEHWKDEYELKNYSIKGFKLINAFCRLKGEHGGCAIYAREHFKLKPREDIRKMSLTRIIECSAAEVKMNGVTVIFICVYRPEKDINKFFKIMEEILKYIINGKNTVFLAGDFNINLNIADKNTTFFVNLMESYGLKPTTLVPTRVTADSSSCIDNIFTNCNNYESQVLNTHISDHHAVKVAWKVKGVEKKEIIYKRIFDDRAKQDLRASLMDVNWKEVYSCDERNVNDQWTIFANQFSLIYNAVFPKKKIKKCNRKKDKALNDPEVKTIKNKLDILLTLKLYLPQYIEPYKMCKKQYEELLRRKRYDRYANRIETSDNKTRTVWQIVKEIKDDRGKHTETEIPGEIENITNMANRYLATAPKQLIENLDNIPYHSMREINTKSMFMVPVTPNEIIEIVLKLKNKMSCGYDEISVSIIRVCIDIISQPLCHIVNNCFLHGVFPDSLKVAVVSLIHKKGDPEEISNYRPISILPAFSKIFEIAISKRLMRFVDEFTPIEKTQHGFVKGRGVTTALHAFIQEVHDILNKDEIPLGILIDLTKAFDCMNHKLLLQKLEKIGVRGLPLRLIGSYLTDRKQMVKLKKEGKTCFSNMEDIDIGVPQGSIMGPILFLIFINDLKESLTGEEKLVNYADDTSIVLKGKNYEDLSRSAYITMTNIEKWLTMNKLVINKSKTNFMLFQTNYTRPGIPEHLRLGKEHVTLAHTSRLLGVHVDRALTWKAHIEELCIRLGRVCYMLCVLRRYIGLEHLLAVYFASFQSQLRFAVTTWGGSTEIHRIFVLQKRALRLITHTKMRDTCRGKFRSNRILTVPAIYIYETLVSYQKYGYFEETTTHTHYTRKNQINYPKHKRKMYESSPIYVAVSFYNRLPSEMKKSWKTKKFTTELLQYLIDLEPYSMGEFGRQ